MELKIYKPNEEILGFIVTKSEWINEIKCVLTELIHKKTGAKVMHLGNDDPENVFCLSFQTIPDSSNGVAHILEHTVLCGSKKYPINDPFFSMHRRSLNTFMNAFTGSDFTCYPAATQVKKDFYNLLRVYLDSVFNPLLKEFSFLQEGWRLEFSDPSNPNTPLEYKGIVFNEMKGALSSSTARLIEEINKHLFPNLTYGCNSGGDPKEIPRLTYQELLAFHKTYYHPSRCLFYFYGDLPLGDHLKFIEKEVLVHTEQLEPLHPLPSQIRRSEPLKVVAEYPIGLEEDIQDKAIIGFAWLTCHILDQEELLALTALDIILMATDASILKMTLLKSGLCKQANAYLDGDLSEVPFVLVLKGCNDRSADALEDLIMNTIREIVRSGIEPRLIEDAIHQLEFHRSEITGEGYPFGLALFMRSGLLKQHGGKPEDGLQIHAIFGKLLQNLKKDPKYFERLLEKYLLNNPHFVRVLMVPNRDLATKELALERHKLDEIRKEMSDPDVDKLLKKSIDFAEFQKQQMGQNLEVLPKVHLEDVPEKIRDYSLIHETFKNVEIYRHPCFTNGIVYVDLVFPLPEIREQDLPYLSLFAQLMNQLGCGGRTYDENLEYILAHTGGVAAWMMQHIQAKDHSKFDPTFHLKGKALYRKADKLFPLLFDMARGVSFSNRDRIKEFILKHYTALESALNTSGLKYAINLAMSGLNIAGKMNDQCYGLPYFWLIRDLAENFDQKADQFIENLERIQKEVLGLEGAHLVLSCDEKMYESLQKAKFFGLDQIERKPYRPWKPAYSVNPSPTQGRIISSPVAFTAKLLDTISYTHPDAPALIIAGHLFENITLHTEIREQGGAYGVGSSSNVIWGHFAFFAGRDPHIASTIFAFQEAVQILVKGQFEEERLIEAKLEAIQGMDSPIPPGSRAEVAYSWMREGRSPEIRQRIREKLLTLKKSDVISAVENHILPKVQKAPTVVFANRQLLENERSLLQQMGDSTLDVIETV